MFPYTTVEEVVCAFVRNRYESVCRWRPLGIIPLQLVETRLITSTGMVVGPFPFHPPPPSLLL